jgi:phage terminase large subunit GpA-like protein
VAGDPADERTWNALDEQLKRRYRHASGVELAICATAIDSGGHHTDEVYKFTRLRRWRNVIAVKGASKPGRPVLAQRPSKVDVKHNGQTEKQGAELWIIGTDTAKDWIYNRYPFRDGPGALHFSTDLPDEFYEQAVAERKITVYVKGYKRTVWVKGKAERNEVLDLLVYNQAAAQFLGLHRYHESEWGRLRASVSQGSLFAQPAPGSAARADDEQPPRPAPVPSSKPAPQPTARRVSRSAYLKR